MGYEGSGQRALEENEAAIKKLEAKMRELADLQASGENVDAEIRKTKQLFDKLKEDRGRIAEAGMVSVD